MKACHLRTLALLIASLTLCGCPPQTYCLVKNETFAFVKIDFTYEGSGTLLPHFALAAGESRLIKTGAVTIEARRKDGSLIGALDLARVRPNSSFADPGKPDYVVAVLKDKIVPSQ